MNNFLYRDFSFITLQIDGVTEANFYCSFEGLYYYAFHLAEILWGLLWLYDLKFMIGKPTLFTGKYLMYYSCVAYFTAFGFSIVLYFQDVDNFTSASNLLCFVVDDDPIGYYLMFNIPIVVYLAAAIYIHVKFGKDYMPPKQIEQVADQLLAKPKLAPSLYNKLHMNMRIQRVYFIAWFISVIPNFFLNSEAGMVWYSIFNTVHPIVIIVIVLWSLSLQANNLERQTVKEASVPAAGGPSGGNNAQLEMTEYSSVYDDKSDSSILDGNNPEPDLSKKS